MEKKQLQDLNLIDNFLFSKVMNHKVYGSVTANILLKKILGREVNIKNVVSESFIVPEHPQNHGIRLDAYVEEYKSEDTDAILNVYDIEPDKKASRKKQLPKRSRFYHSRMDGSLLPASKEYTDLADSWVIFITSFDPLGANRMVYTIRTSCVELPEIEYNDGAVTLFLYIYGKEGDPRPELQELLRYIGDTTPENACNPDLRLIQKCVEAVKADRSSQEEYMTFRDYIKEEVDEEVNERLEEVEGKLKEADQLVAEANQRAEDANQRAAILEAENQKLLAEIQELRAAQDKR